MWIETYIRLCDFDLQRQAFVYNNKNTENVLLKVGMFMFAALEIS